MHLHAWLQNLNQVAKFMIQLQYTHRPVASFNMREVNGKKSVPRAGKKIVLINIHERRGFALRVAFCRINSFFIITTMFVMTICVDELEQKYLLFLQYQLSCHSECVSLLSQKASSLPLMPS